MKCFYDMPYSLTRKIWMPLRAVIQASLYLCSSDKIVVTRKLSLNENFACQWVTLETLFKVAEVIQSLIEPKLLISSEEMTRTLFWFTVWQVDDEVV